MLIASPQKIGRNDRCPCGSGKKYKHCCLNNTANSTDAIWRRVHAAFDTLHSEMMGFAARDFEYELEEAWDDFNFGATDDLLDLRSPEMASFLPYFFYRWFPVQPSDTAGPDDTLIAMRFARENSRRLSDLQFELLKLCLSQPFTFFEVTSLQPGRSIDVREIFTGREAHILEHTGSRLVRSGDILYGQEIPVSGISVFNWLAPVLTPPSRKGPIVGLRGWIRAERAKEQLSLEDVLIYEDEIRELYLATRDFLNTPPVICNTDHELLEPHTMTFEVGSTQLAFDALCSLAVDVPKEELLEAAEYDAGGNLQSIEFHWLKRGNRKMKSWDNTILGRISLSGTTLIAEVNSEKRAVKLRKEIEFRLGLAVSHKSTVVMSCEELMEKVRRTDMAKLKEPQREQVELLKDPQLREQLRDSIQKQVDLWIKMKLPALGGLTPLQAVRDTDGREIVESLVIDYERQLQTSFPEEVRPDMSFVRKRLKLDARRPISQ